MQGFRAKGTFVAVQDQVELGIVPFNSLQETVHADLRIQFFADFTDKGLLRRFTRFHLSARPLPEIFPIAIPPLGGK